MNIASSAARLVTVVLGVCALAAGYTAGLTWKFTDNRTALCNDFTRAGFFHRNASGAEKKWVIFLESGSLCYSNETCNRRYFQSHLRERYSTNFRGQSIFGNFDTASAWEKAKADGQLLAEVVNPLMTSTYCFRNKTAYFKSVGDLTIEGTDLLSRDCTENPTFCNHGHILVPYCSSDVWLGNENATTRQYSSLLKEGPCDCWDQDCFRYNPTSSDLQFTFRGQTIFHSVLQTLDDMYNLQGASEIVLVGSSAGGVGVLNSAKWVREEYQNVSIKVIADSSWFINFRDSINQEFGAIVNNSMELSNKRYSDALLGILDSNKACFDTRLGYPCCLSAQCLLQENRKMSAEPYYPHDIPTFILTSLYDLFILANALARLNPVLSDQYNTIGFALQLLTTVGEYGGAMNSSVIDTDTTTLAPNLKLSYYATQCFQHVYFATSTLRGRGTLLGSEVIKISSDITTVRHKIQSGVWSSQKLAYHEGQAYTIRDAIHYWYWNVSDGEEGVAFRDVCSGPRCNNECPEELILEGESTQAWSGGAKIAIAVIVLTIAAVCLLMKVISKAAGIDVSVPSKIHEARHDKEVYVYSLNVSGLKEYTVHPFRNKQLYCCMWIRCLHWKQKYFLKANAPRMDEERYSDTDSTTTVKMEFPHCTDEKAISVACLDLHYYVNVHSSVQEKDNKNDHSPITLNNLQPEDELTVCPTKSMDFEVSSTQHEGTKRNKQGVLFGTHRKKILKGISAYFNPKELIAIMGPSGCGKTTFLDLLTGRRKAGTFYGDIFINGLPIEENLNWYISNTGYVLQLAAPYYEELTVRENLTLAAWVKLHINSREKFQRVEQVMEVTGLQDLADTVVGGATGLGLSGGQKRRLVVALQLLKLPSVIFLDEPTSGLDSTSSTELLTHLNALAASNRTVVLTIHQPRLEIFHMFHRIIVLTDGKVAYHGVPEKAYEVFVNSLHSCYLKQSLVIPDLEDHNPADVIMDILGNQGMRKMVIDYYEETGEQTLVSKAIAKAWVRERGFSDNSIDFDAANSSKFDTMRLIVQGSRHTGRTHNFTISRLAALEARAMKRATLAVILYLPIIFFGYGFLLGTVYFQQTTPFLIISGFCVYSVASALFMFPALYGYLFQALTIYAFERADGAGRSADLVFQSFVRFTSMAFFPVILCAGLLYILLINRSRWDLMEFLQVALVNIALNQVWTALLIWLIITFPQKSLRLSPVLSAVAGFTSGFFIPINDIPWWYRWLCYINPNYYGFSASAVILLSEFESDCERDGGSDLECYATSGKYILDSFNFNDINPYENIIVLVGMTLIFLVVAVLSNWVKFLDLSKFLAKFKLVIEQTLLSSSVRAEPPVFYPSLYDSDDENADEEELAENENCVEPPATEELREGVKGKRLTTMNSSIHKDTDFELSQSPTTNTIETSNGTQLRPERRRKSIKEKKERRKALYLDEGQAHTVWKPKRLTKKQSSGVSTTMLELEKQRQDLYERQQKLLSRVKATQEVLKVQREELATLDKDDTEEEGIQDNAQQVTLNERGKRQNVITRETEENSKLKKKRRNRKKRSMHFHNSVSQYVAAMAKHSPYRDTPTAVPFRNRVPSTMSLKATSLQMGVMPLRQWKSLVFEEHKVTDARQKHLSQSLSPFETRIVTNHDTVSGEFDTTPTMATASGADTGENHQPRPMFSFES